MAVVIANSLGGLVVAQLRETAVSTSLDLVILLLRVGVIFLLYAIIGGIISSQRQPRYYYSSGSYHIRWCYSRYRSYRAYDNTYQPYYGPRRQCVSP